MARGADEIAQDGDVGTVCANATGVNRQAQALGLVEIDASIIELRKAKTRRRLHAIHAGRINRTGRTVPLPRAARHLVELLPIAFLPSVHGWL